jgi:hypothetical protein
MAQFNNDPVTVWALDKPNLFIIEGLLHQYVYTIYWKVNRKLSWLLSSSTLPINSLTQFSIPCRILFRIRSNNIHIYFPVLPPDYNTPLREVHSGLPPELPPLLSSGQLPQLPRLLVSSMGHNLHSRRQQKLYTIAVYI